MPSLRLGNQETSYVVQIYNDPEWNETVKELFSNSCDFFFGCDKLDLILKIYFAFSKNIKIYRDVNT